MIKYIELSFNEMLEKVSQGYSFSINLKKRQIKLGKKHILPDMNIVPHMSQEEAVQAIERLYRVYMYSKPSEKSDRQRRTYFRAMEEQNLPAEAMLYGENREVARFKLEYTFLILLLNGSFQWVWNGWFWQSDAYPSLIILREWVE